MAIYGHIEAELVTETIVASAEYIATRSDAAEWMEMPFGVGVDWSYVGGVFTGPDGESLPTPPAVIPVERFLLTGSEWVQRFTDAEWKWLKAQRATGTAAGDQLDRLMDAIRWTDSIDVSSPNMDSFYDWLLTQGIPGGQTRIDELRAAV